MAGNPDAGIAILGVLKSILSPSGDIELEPRTNSLIVTDIPEVFPQVEQIIAELDKKAPQVMIEAQIVEIDSSTRWNLGFEWGGSNGELGSFTAGERDTTFPLNLPRILQRRISSIPSPTLSTAWAFPPMPQRHGRDDGNVRRRRLVAGSIQTGPSAWPPEITLRALVSEQGRFLGKPKILTLNNKPRRIEYHAPQAGRSQPICPAPAGGKQSHLGDRYGYRRRP